MKESHSKKVSKRERKIREKNQEQSIKKPKETGFRPNISDNVEHEPNT